MTTPTKKKRNRLWLLVEIILVGIIIWQGVQIGRYYWDTKTSRSAYEKIEQAVKQVQTPEPEKTEVAAAPVAEDPKERADRMLTMLKELNEDTVGYIDIDALGIHYPIVQGIDNDEYLYQSFEGEYSIAGTIYIDGRPLQEMTNRDLAPHMSSYNYYISNPAGSYSKNYNGGNYNELKKIFIHFHYFISYSPFN